MFFAIRRTQVETILDLRVSEISVGAMIGLAGSRCASIPVRRAMAIPGSSYSSARRMRAGLRMPRCVAEYRLGLVSRLIKDDVAALSRQCATLRNGQEAPPSTPAG
jgi:hypothetical protein